MGLYIHAGRNDHRELLNLIPQGTLGCFGLVLEATSLKRHRELLEMALASRLDAILDPRTQPAGTAGGYSDEIGSLPWALSRPNVPGDFEGARGRGIIAAIGDCVLKNGFTQVKAPTHVLQSAADDWLSIDVESTHHLREHLNRSDGAHIQVLYSLAINYATFRDPVERRLLIKALRDLPADAIWLRVDGLGAKSTPNGVRGYIEAARDFAGLSMPIVAEGMGGLAGLSLLAFGAVGGIAHGVTFGERVDNSSWRRPRTGHGFGRSRRVYIAELDLMLDPESAGRFLHSSKHAQANFACRDTDCCRVGLKDMLEDPARHFLIQRGKQVVQLGRVPETIRAKTFLENQLRPASDALVKATNMRVDDEDLQKILRVQRKRVDALRVTLSEMERGGYEVPRVELPKTRMARQPDAGAWR
jgi:hypothetical protein